MESLTATISLMKKDAVCVLTASIIGINIVVYTFLQLEQCDLCNPVVYMQTCSTNDKFNKKLIRR